MQSLIKGIFSLVYPSFCYVCGVYLPPLPSAPFCPACYQKIRFINPPYCPRCGSPYLGGFVEVSHLCENCLQKRPPYHSARALAAYGPELGVLIHQFKYRKKRHLGFLLVGLAANHKSLLRELSPVDAVIPVPLHPKRRRKRGFNQAEVLARAIARYLKAPVVVNQLRKVKNTPPQTGLSREERLRNVRGAFRLGSRWHYARHRLRSAYSALRKLARYRRLRRTGRKGRKPEPPVFLRGKRVLLVDDVYTTGATVSECSRVLRRGGVKEVRVFTLTRVVY